MYQVGIAWRQDRCTNAYGMPSGATPVVLPPSTQMEKQSHYSTKLSIVDMAWHNDTYTYRYMRSLIFHSVLRTPAGTRFVPSTCFWSRTITNIFGFQAPGRTGSIGDLWCYQRILGEHKVGWGFTNKNHNEKRSVRRCKKINNDSYSFSTLQLLKGKSWSAWKMNKHDRLCKGLPGWCRYFSWYWLLV